MPEPDSDLGLISTVLSRRSPGSSGPRPCGQWRHLLVLLCYPTLRSQRLEPSQENGQLGLFEQLEGQLLREHRRETDASVLKEGRDV